MVGSIQVFRYEYAPSLATVRNKVGNEVIMKRPVSKVHEYNRNNLTELQTTIQDIQSFEHGVYWNCKIPIHR